MLTVNTFATCVALAPGAHTSAAVARMPWATLYIVEQELFGYSSWSVVLLCVEVKGIGALPRSLYSEHLSHILILPDTCTPPSPRARARPPRPRGPARRAGRVFRTLMRYDEISRQIKLGHAVRSRPQYSL